MSDTPRTDAFHSDPTVRFSYEDALDFAHTLERELAARDAEVARLRELAFALYRGPQEGSADYEGARLDVGRLMRASIAQPKEPS